MTFASSSRNGLMQFPAKYEKQYRDARDSRTLHFHNRQYLKSSVKLLIAFIQIDWFFLSMGSFWAGVPHLRQELVKGLFLTKASSSWAGKSQSIEVSLYLPNQRDLDTWYEAGFETMIGRSSWVDSLFVWFPAAWMPLVVEAVREKSFGYCQSVSQLGAVAFTDRSQIEVAEALEFITRSNGGRLTARGCCPVLQSHQC